MNDVGIEGDCNVDAMEKRSWTPALISGDPARDPWLSVVLPSVQDASRGGRSARAAACAGVLRRTGARDGSAAILLLSLAADPPHALLSLADTDSAAKVPPRGRLPHHA
ncbi:hypothetical protein WME89_15780 [Sorangium sp. So ce321]|uniref:hypothetical protein n=1 Tax=Sorangium sp. So ce321 TaxID=3133300 RepID=UPI003F604CC9